MVRLWIFLMIVIVGTSCSNNSVEAPLPEMYAMHSIYDFKNADNTKRAILFGNNRYRESGMLVNGKKEGPWVYYDKKGFTPRVVANYENDTLNGSYTEYNNSTYMTVSTNCKGGVFDGEYRGFEEIVLIKLQTFVEGKLEGKAITYYPVTGMQMSVLYYKEGKQHGIATYFNETGHPIHEYTYENGEQISNRELK
jgi:antitoxin component YwqK of YwqJK toxin-antitoxin module